jgi:hypothetical protein
VRNEIQAIGRAFQGQIDQRIFKPDHVIRALRNVELSKSSQFQLLLSDLHKDLPSFYKMKSVVISLPGNKHDLTIGIIIPMINDKETFGLYYHESIPLSLPISGLEISHNLDAHYLLIDRTRTTHLSLTAEELMMCTHVDDIYMCPHIKLLTKGATCLSALFTGKSRASARLCPYQVRYKKGLTVRATGANNFLVSTAISADLLMSCDNNRHDRLLKVDPGQSHFSLPEGCSVDSAGAFIVASSNNTLTEESSFPVLLFRSDKGGTLLDNLQRVYPHLPLSTKGLEQLRDSIRLTEDLHSLAALEARALDLRPQPKHTALWIAVIVTWVVGLVATIFTLVVYHWTTLKEYYGGVRVLPRSVTFNGVRTLFAASTPVEEPTSGTVPTPSRGGGTELKTGESNMDVTFSPWRLATPNSPK